LSKTKKTFTAITSQILNGKLVLLYASDGRKLYKEQGIDFSTGVEFLFKLRYQAKADKGNVFVSYAFARDIEFLFAGLPNDIKDRLFKSYSIRRQINELENEQEHFDHIYFSALPDSQEYEQADFFRHINYLALQELNTVEYQGYRLQLANGKRLVIRKGSKQIVIFDIFGFFNRPLRQAVKVWLQQDVSFLDRHSLKIHKGLERQQLEAFANFEVKYIERLATKLNVELENCGINLRSYHGASAVTSWMLSKGKARSRQKPQYYNYRYKRQLSPALHKACYQAYFAGRAEQFKIGTVQNIKVYDINSAYAYSASKLPVMLKKPTYSREWLPQPFSLWRCEYDFTSLQPYFGLLPNRETGGQISYKMRGKGCYWQPEISYILEHYPQCINVLDGYYLEYERAPFTFEIEFLYELRRFLQSQKNPLEKIIKLALAAVYGKFCQARGKGEYVNMFYAGFVTSLTRMQLLDATRGRESSVACFLTDAIHTTDALAVNVSDALGDYKVTEYERGIYLDSGIYRLIDSRGRSKTKSSGFRNFNFDAALLELSSKRKFSAIIEYFTSHNLHALAPIRYSKYLETFQEKQESQPLITSTRKFETNQPIDLTKSFIDSVPYNLFAGRESLPYNVNGYSDKDKNINTFLAERA